MFLAGETENFLSERHKSRYMGNPIRGPFYTIVLSDVRGVSRGVLSWGT